jgi:hypothetical protein
LQRQSAQHSEGDRHTPEPVTLWLGTGRLDIALYSLVHVSLRAYLSRFQSLPRLARREETPGLFQILLPHPGGVYQFFVDVSPAYDVCLSQDARGANSEQETSGRQSNRLPHIKTHSL